MYYQLLASVWCYSYGTYSVELQHTLYTTDTLAYVYIPIWRTPRRMFLEAWRRKGACVPFRC